METRKNSNPAELAKFDALSGQWWDPKGELGALHDINPTRLAYISQRVPLNGKQVLDVGCGGGLLAESLAGLGARVTGIDMAPKALRAAERHRLISGIEINYRLSSAEGLVYQPHPPFDVVTCMELLEHVPNPASLVESCAALVKPGGHIFFATLNKTVASHVLAILAAEYLLGIVRKKTHDWKKFIPPQDLVRWGQNAGLTLADLSGMVYIPWIRFCRIGGAPMINYVAHFIKARPSE
jgi:2-polyprenyl-6-hydroxyphenyl methylase / 3-demethylubiquinone-9 3-methyltransferase